MPTARRASDYDERVISAAREIFAEQGFAAPMSEIARRADVGVASIYRRYPSKQDLAEQVRVACSSRVIAEAEHAMSTESDPWRAFTRFLHGCLAENTGIGTVLPPRDDCGSTSDELRELRRRMSEVVEQLVAAVRRNGDLRSDVGSADVFLLFKHLNPPLATNENRRAQLRARYLTLMIEGMRARPDTASHIESRAEAPESALAAAGDPPTWDELRAMCEGSESTADSARRN